MAHRASRPPDPVAIQTPRGLVVAVDLEDPQRPLEPELLEFEALIEAAGAKVVERIVQRRSKVDASTLIGSGKAIEIAEHAKAIDASILFVFNDLRTRQRKNLEKIVPLAIVDRTMLILDVFARQARSREGKLQVELAQLKYRQSNLIGMGAELSRLGGGIGTRGPGETKLEVDRRKISQRVAILERQLEDVRRQRETRRSAPNREPLVALVGYTNVGKSSLLNALTKSDALVADRPFATLDPTVRRLYVSPGRYVRLADTVGFITDLPKDLVNAFRATLEELRSADLLIHVVDASNPDWHRQRESVEHILGELHLDETPRLLVANKCDLAVDGGLPSEALPVSARTGLGLPELRAKLDEASQTTKRLV